MLPVIATLLCLTLFISVLILLWMAYRQQRERREAVEIIPLETAICIQKKDGSILIRQQRMRSLLGIVAGLIMVGGGVGFAVSARTSTIDLQIAVICLVFALLILGSLVGLISLRGLFQPHIEIDVTQQIIRFRRGIPRRRQTRSFEEVAGIIKRPLSGENFLANSAQLALIFVSSYTTDTADLKTVAIGIQDLDGRKIHLCTAPSKAARSVTSMLVAATGKRVLEDSEQDGIASSDTTPKQF